MTGIKRFVPSLHILALLPVRTAMIVSPVARVLNFTIAPLHQGPTLLVIENIRYFSNMKRSLLMRVSHFFISCILFL